MIVLEHVYKRYTTDHKPSKWVLQDVSVTIPSRSCVGVVGAKGSGKTTFLRLLAGSETPTEGQLTRDARIAIPLGYIRSFQPLLTGHQNAKFICRINGNVEDLEERLKAIQDVSELGDKFEKPVRTYTSVMKSRLSFALSVVLDFDVYISDGFDFSGEIAYKNKNIAEEEIEKIKKRAGLIMVGKGLQGDATLKRYCQSGIWLHDGMAEWFDDINDAIEANKSSQPLRVAKRTEKHTEPELSDQARLINERIKQLNYQLKRLLAGVNGKPVSVTERDIERLINAASQIGMTLMTTEQISKQGCQLVKGSSPILIKRATGSGVGIGFYDLNSQCEKMERNA